MAWTPTEIFRGILKGALVVSVEYTDGTKTFREDYRTATAQDADWLNTIVDRRVKELALLENFASTLGDIATPKPPADPIPPTQDELDRAAYIADIRLLRQLEAAAAVTVGKIDQVAIDEVAGRLKANFKDGYEVLFR